jgi:hypothetical protein
MNEEKRNVYRLLVGRPRYRLVDNIKIDLRELGWGDMDWIDLDQDRDWWTALKNGSLGSIKFWEGLEQLHDWRSFKKGSALWSWLVGMKNNAPL